MTRWFRFNEGCFLTPPNQMLLSGWVFLRTMAASGGTGVARSFPPSLGEILTVALHGHGGAYRIRTGAGCLEGSGATTTPMLRITAGGHKTGGLSVQLSCVTDFRIATAFTRRRGRSIPCSQQQDRRSQLRRNAPVEERAGFEPAAVACAGRRSSA